MKKKETNKRRLNSVGTKCTTFQTHLRVIVFLYLYVWILESDHVE